MGHQSSSVQTGIVWFVTAIRPLMPTCAAPSFLLGADRGGVDRRRGGLGVAEPFLRQVERDGGRDGRDPEPVPQPLGRSVGFVETGASITAFTARQPVIRLQGHRRTPRPLPRPDCSSRTLCTTSKVSSKAGAPARCGLRRCGVFSGSRWSARLPIGRCGRRSGPAPWRGGSRHRRASRGGCEPGDRRCRPCAGGGALAGGQVFTGAVDRVQRHSDLRGRGGNSR